MRRPSFALIGPLLPCALVALGAAVDASAMPRPAWLGASRLIVRCGAGADRLCGEVLAEARRGAPMPVLAPLDRKPARGDVLLLVDRADGAASATFVVTTPADPDESASAPTRPIPLPADPAARRRVLADALDRLLPWRAVNRRPQAHARETSERELS